MNAFAFKVIDAINREGIGNEAWGLVEEVDDTVAYFRHKRRNRTERPVGVRLCR